MFWDIFLSVLIATLSVAATITAWFGKAADSRFSGLKKLLPIGWWVSVFLLLSLILTGINGYRSSKAQQTLSDTVNVTKSNSEKILTADSAIKSVLQTISINSDSSGKLFIKSILNSEGNIVSTIKDSVKKNVTNYYGDAPFIGFDETNPANIVIYKNAVRFTLSFEAKHNTAYHVNLKFGTVIIDSGKYKILDKLFTASTDDIYEQDEPTGFGYTLPGIYSQYFIFLQAYYQDISSKKYNYKQVASIKLLPNNKMEFTFVSPPYKEQIMNLFK